MSRYLGKVSLDDTTIRAGQKLYLSSAGGGTVQLYADPTSSSNLTFQYPATGGNTGQGLGSFNGTGILSYFDFAKNAGNALGAAFSVGTTDAFNFSLKSNNVTRLTLDQAAPAVELNGNSTVALPLKFMQADNTAAVSVKAPNTGVTSYTLTLPAVQATAAGQVLSNNGSGVLSWVTDVNAPSHYLETTITANATATTDYNVYLCDATAGNITLTLPALPSGDQIYQVIKTDASANTVTVAPATGEMFNTVVDGTFTMTAQYDKVGFFGTSLSWFLM